MSRLPISAIVVSKNEGALLEQCLSSIQFCEEIVLIDLQSTDDTLEIAGRLATECLTMEPVPLVEIIHEKYIPRLRHDWVLIIDPDEVCSTELQTELMRGFAAIQSSSGVGGVVVPHRFYFKAHLLLGTPCGGINAKILLANKRRFLFTSHVHQGRTLAAGFAFHKIEFTGRNFVHHYWMQSYSRLIEKHVRYLKNEGQARFNCGRRTWLAEILKSPFREFKFSFQTKAGWRDGFTGLILSFFWAWYQTMALIKLLHHQTTHQHRVKSSVIHAR